MSLDDSLSIRCSFTAEPVPTIQWLKDGESFSGSGSRVQISSSEFDSTLRFQNVQSNDEAEYSCKISNSEGFEISKCNLEIEKPKPKKVSKVEVAKPSKQETSKQETFKSEPVKKEPVKQETVKEKKLETPKTEPIKENNTTEIVNKAAKEPKLFFAKHLSSQNLMEGQALNLECQVSPSKDSYELIWLRNGKEIPENPDFLREKIDNTHKLTVSEIFPEDSGVFSAEIFCEATNQTLLSSCSVVVQGSLFYVHF